MTQSNTIYFKINKNTFKWIVLGLLASLFLGLSYFSHVSNLDYTQIDQRNFLRGAIELSNLKSPVEYFTGSIKTTGQHPLYIWLCYLFTSKEIQFFTKAKFLSNFLALIFYLVFGGLIRKQYGFLVSVISISILITSNEYIRYLSWVGCEYLLLTFTFLTWYFITNGFTNQKLWILGGGFNGLAYLSKPTGFLFLPSFIISYFIINLKNKSLKDSIKNKYFYLYFASFILTSSPLLIRNIIVHRNPFYNWNQKIMWLDRKPYWRIRDLAEREKKYKDSTMQNYIKKNGVKKIIERLISGWKSQFSVFILSLGGAIYITGANYHTLNIIIYSILWIFAFIFLLKDRNAERRIYNFVLFCLFYSIIAFLTPVLTKQYRFFMPINSIFIIYAAIGINNLFIAAIARFKPSRYPSNVIELMIITLFLGVVLLKVFINLDYSKNPFNLNHLYKDYDHLFNPS